MKKSISENWYKIVMPLFGLGGSLVLVHIVYNIHWRSSHYTVTDVRNKNSNIQGRSPNVIYHKELLLKEIIRSLWERSSHFEKGHS